MSSNVLTRTLQVAYPLAILLGLLACAGISLVDAGGPDPIPRLPNPGTPRLDPALVSTRAGTCSVDDRCFE